MERIHYYETPLTKQCHYTHAHSCSLGVRQKKNIQLGPRKGINKTCPALGLVKNLHHNKYQ